MTPARRAALPGPEAGGDAYRDLVRQIGTDGWLGVGRQKVFTTGGNDADWVWLAVRTDPEAPKASASEPTQASAAALPTAVAKKKHKGISILLVDTNQPGYKHSPIHLLGGGFTNVTYYEDVHVPASSLVGKENEGWKMITNQLNHERVALAPAGMIDRHLQAVLRWAKQTPLADGRRVIDQEWVRISLARVHAQVDALTLANWHVASALTERDITPAA